MEQWDEHTHMLKQTAMELRYMTRAYCKQSHNSDVMRGVMDEQIVELLIMTTHTIRSVVSFVEDSEHYSLTLQVLSNIEEQVVRLSDSHYDGDTEAYYEHVGDALSDIDTLLRICRQVAEDKGLFKKPKTIDELLNNTAHAVILVEDKRMLQADDSMPVIKRPVRRD